MFLQTKTRLEIVCVRVEMFTQRAVKYYLADFGRIKMSLTEQLEVKNPEQLIVTLRTA